MKQILIVGALALLVLVCTAAGYVVGLMTGDPKACAEGGCLIGVLVAFAIGMEEVL